MPIPHTEGTTHMMAPLTPDLAGMPTSRDQSPLDSYMPANSICDNVMLTVRGDIKRWPRPASPKARPPFASMAAMRERCSVLVFKQSATQYNRTATLTASSVFGNGSAFPAFCLLARKQHNPRFLIESASVARTAASSYHRSAPVPMALRISTSAGSLSVQQNSAISSSVQVRCNFSNNVNAPALMRGFGALPSCKVSKAP
mmetsp:Transcript_18503/g.50803  ORF Transcript_18503/g.50803 Transcript_18503/m.50803 type:complete len:201 (+) Transcript_18503:274-876(+)